MRTDGPRIQAGRKDRNALTPRTNASVLGMCVLDARSAGERAKVDALRRTPRSDQQTQTATEPSGAIRLNNEARGLKIRNGEDGRRSWTAASGKRRIDGAER
jgi:hypothetical protein